MISLIVAHSRNRVIGDEADIPWKLKDDLQRFRDKTKGHSIIMGRKTFESKPLGRPLPNRRNIVVTRNKKWSHDGVEVAHSLDEALKMTKGEDEVFVIGGGEIYKQAIDKADKIYATVIQVEVPGDAYFPRVNLKKWQLDSLEKHHDKEMNVDYYYADYIRRRNPAELYYIDAGRELEQIMQMEDLERRKVCFMCYENFKKERPGEIIFETDHWYVSNNKYPYKHTKQHILFVPKSHVTTVGQLSKDARNDMTEVITQIEKKYKLKHYSIFMRSGEMPYTGATVAHIHGHIIVGDHDHPDFESIKIKVATRPRN